MTPTKRASPDEHATDAEVEAAIRALSDVQLVRLGKVASFRARALAGLGFGISAEDLLQEAICRTIAGARHWRKTVVTFEKHLIETMRSISDHAHDELAGASVVPGTIEDDRGYLDGVPLRSAGLDGEWSAAAKEQLEKIAVIFANDDEVNLVVEGLAAGLTGPDIQADLKITQNDYETIMTRLRRGLDREEGWRPS
jgi:hypothetical protein